MADAETFDSLSATLRDWVEASKKAKKQEGIEKLLSSLYPDQAHFIYELLQNAEDAGAESITFTLADDGLTVTHDGPKPFSLADIESITGIGESTKTNDATKIGKFGVGFKAVFAYTTRPEIRSGEYSFAIDDLFVPVRIPGAARPGLTTFTFPFDRQDKSAAVARTEITRGLSDLGETTLLFLTHIRAITYELPDGSVGIIERRTIDEQVICINKVQGDDYQESFWLRLIGSASIQRDDAPPLTVGAAFRLERLEDPAPKRGKKSEGSAAGATRFAIVPTHEGDVSIYFPAVKESSGLRFHIHAPFASTVARDSVRDDPDNDRLIGDIASVITQALPLLCDQGLINDSFLATMPNEDDQIGHPYSHIRTAITAAFNTLDIAPVWGSGGGYAPANSLVSSPSEFRNWLDPSDLPVLFELAQIEVEQVPHWIRDRDGRAGRFLAGLDTVEFAWDELSNCLDSARDIDDPEDAFLPVWTKWLEAKSDSRIADLYQLIGRGRATYELHSIDLKSIPIVRLRRRGSLEHVKGPDTFLPSSPNDTAKSRVPAEFAYFDDDEDQTRASYLRAFYSAVGTKRWNQTTKIERRLSAYADRKAPFPDGDALTRHLDDVSAFVSFGLASPSTAEQIFAKVPFLLAAQSDGSWRWATPVETLLDVPFRNTGLTTLYPRIPLHWKRGGGYAYDQEPYALAGLYSEVEGIEDFLEIVGARVGLEIIHVDVTTNEQFSWMWKVSNKATSYGKNIDWGIERLDDIIDSGDPDLLRTLWHTVAAAPKSKADAAFQANGSAQRHAMESQLVQALKVAAWVLDRNGDFKAPRELTLAELPEDWEVPLPGSLVHKLEFGAEDHRRRQKTEGVTAFLREEGLDDDSIDFLREAKVVGLSIADMREIVRERKAYAAFPEGPSGDPERRTDVAAGAAATAPLHSTEIRPRTVVVDHGLASAETKAYLRHHYTDAAGAMFCQACQKPMPFRMKDGQWYFEAVRFVTARKRVLTTNAIALCPLCAALYKYSRETKNATLFDDLCATPVAEGQGTVQIPVVLNGKRVKVAFTGKHAIDLQAALRTAGDER